ncbi:MAG: HTH domain-containing protein [Clostridia bacterium]|nr:HTH domain-containing protein [Clostridia bacterium]
MSSSLEKRGTQDDPQASVSEKLIKLIRENKKATRKQMAEALSVSTRTIQRLLNRRSQQM